MAIVKTGKLSLHQLPLDDSLFQENLGKFPLEEKNNKNKKA
jgi:hypothetical protein